jgi:trans-aconitate methyltransferase
MGEGVSKNTWDSKLYDMASSMIEAARSKYPDIQFSTEDAVCYRTSKTFDAVFSNAALHWTSYADYKRIRIMAVKP